MSGIEKKSSKFEHRLLLSKSFISSMIQAREMTLSRYSPNPLKKVCYQLECNIYPFAVAPASDVDHRLAVLVARSTFSKEMEAVGLPVLLVECCCLGEERPWLAGENTAIFFT